ncbi:uncharacterized protein LOC105444095 [Strongylocentrotus purpuratus]|uniref:EGF-like domain-containing protein n=1 Tax=Strongylocentrotus purpuratus TaxID=7668 RepID=A0A7M7P8W3_STRPU|nr:uncharacterized protein LOC105444095 [Strongylocentrotus purpuratus]|eukprot:XP_011676207.1 PREDICTED: uncharacterized protein LOC105444095 [Strongylocentrotus purpuratus]
MILIVTVVFFTSVCGFTSAKTPTSCQRSSFGDMELNYSLPIHPPCGDFRLSNGSMIIKIPKLIPRPLMKSCRRDNIPAGYRICRRPDCLSGPCMNGWCEETMEAYLCHCPEGFSGKDCSIGPGPGMFLIKPHSPNKTDTRPTTDRTKMTIHLSVGINSGVSLAV